MPGTLNDKETKLRFKSHRTMPVSSDTHVAVPLDILSDTDDGRTLRDRNYKSHGLNEIGRFNTSLSGQTKKDVKRSIRYSSQDPPSKRRAIANSPHLFLGTRSHIHSPTTNKSSAAASGDDVRGRTDIKLGSKRDPSISPPHDVKRQQTESGSRRSTRLREAREGWSIKNKPSKANILGTKQKSQSPVLVESDGSSPISCREYTAHDDKVSIIKDNINEHGDDRKLKIFSRQKRSNSKVSDHERNDRHNAFGLEDTIYSSEVSPLDKSHITRPLKHQKMSISGTNSNLDDDTDELQQDILFSPQKSKVFSRHQYQDTSKKSHPSERRISTSTRTTGGSSKHAISRSVSEAENHIRTLQEATDAHGHETRFNIPCEPIELYESAGNFRGPFTRITRIPSGLLLGTEHGDSHKINNNSFKKVLYTEAGKIVLENKDAEETSYMCLEFSSIESFNWFLEDLKKHTHNSQLFTKLTKTSMGEYIPTPPTGDRLYGLNHTGFDLLNGQLRQLRYLWCAQKGPIINRKKAKLNKQLMTEEESLLSHRSPSLSRLELHSKVARGPEGLTKRQQTKKLSTPIIQPLMKLNRNQAATKDLASTSTKKLDLGKPWKGSLLFPRNESRQVTLTYEDLKLLQSGGLLNDNVIEFGIRYAQWKNKRRTESVYSFNTYFYSTLTSTGQTELGINYNAVKRWTSKINLFDYDFVIVPINEDIHWYAAIICNLREIAPQSGKGKNNASSLTGPRDTVEQLDAGCSRQSELNERDEIQPEQTKPEDQAENVTAKADPANSIPTEDQAHTNEANTLPSPRMTDRTTRECHEVRIESSTPAIIILDSLGGNHSLVYRNLRKYLKEEAKFKYDWRISTPKKVHAEGIPQQDPDNFSDCGVYLMAYLEEFLKNPFLFVRKVLKSEFKQQNWKLSAPALRSYYRDIIIHEYENQASVQSTSVSKGAKSGVEAAPNRSKSTESDKLANTKLGESDISGKRGLCSTNKEGVETSDKIIGETPQSAFLSLKNDVPPNQMRECEHSSAIGINQVPKTIGNENEVFHDKNSSLKKLSQNPLQNTGKDRIRLDDQPKLHTKERAKNESISSPYTRTRNAAESHETQTKGNAGYAREEGYYLPNKSPKSSEALQHSLVAPEMYWKSNDDDDMLEKKNQNGLTNKKVRKRETSSKVSGTVEILPESNTSDPNSSSTATQKLCVEVRDLHLQMSDE